MDEKTKNKEYNGENREYSPDSRGEFRDLVEMGAYKSLSSNEFFQKLQPEEQFDAMQNTLQNCLQKREQRFFRLVQQKPDLATVYRNNEIKPLREAIGALDEIALESGKKSVPKNLFQEDDIVEDIA